MRYDYTLYSKNIFGIFSTIFWLLTTFLFAVDITHFFKLYSQLKPFKVASLGYGHDLQPTITLMLVIGIIFIFGSLLFIGNLVYLTYKKPKILSTFIVPALTIILVLAVILPLTPHSINLVFQIPEPFLTDTVLSSMPADLLSYIVKVPYNYWIFWMQLVSPIVASVFQFLGIMKIKNSEENK